VKADDSIAGWYGKLPCLGDFASRRLPGEFISAWDAWLRHSIAASREQLSDRWLDSFLVSPMWRFVMGAGVCGPSAWTGLLVPSVDKVGRYFPLTFALPLRDSTVALECVFGNHAWYADLENIALAALSINFSVEGLESRLEQIPFVPDGVKCSLSPALDEWLGSPAAASFDHQFVDLDAALPAIRTNANVTCLSQLGARSVWWCVGVATGATGLHCVQGLPDGYRYTRMLCPGPGATNAPLH
jgi:type VI secretion system protein ImpM